MKSVARVQSWMNLAAAADDFPSSSASAPACACACNDGVVAVSEVVVVADVVGVVVVVGVDFGSAKRPFVTGRCASLFAVPCAYGRQDKPLSFAL